MRTLEQMDNALQRFLQYRPVFEEHGIRLDGFSLPRQHSLFHYILAIQLFGSPNGLCSSITESKHIPVVKKPWRASSKNYPLLEILQRNVRLSKISAARIDFAHRGMLRGDVLTATRIEVGDMDEDDYIPPEDICPVLDDDMDDEDDENDVGDMGGSRVESFTSFPSRQGKSYQFILIYTHALL